MSRRTLKCGVFLSLFFLAFFKGCCGFFMYVLHLPSTINLMSVLVYSKWVPENGRYTRFFFIFCQKISYHWCGSFLKLIQILRDQHHPVKYISWSHFFKIFFVVTFVSPHFFYFYSNIVSASFLRSQQYNRS